MIEVEEKYRLSRQAAEDLVADGALGLGPSVYQADLIYLHGVTSFKELVPGSPVIRIRQLDQAVIVTVKRKLMGGGGFQEAELNLAPEPAGLAAAQDFLATLGWSLVTEVRKQRRTGVCDGVTVVLDDVAGLGCFVELELVVTGQAELAAAQARLTAVRQKLGLNPADQETRKYDEMVAESRT